MYPPFPPSTTGVGGIGIGGVGGNLVGPNHPLFDIDRPYFSGDPHGGGMFDPRTGGGIGGGGLAIPSPRYDPIGPVVGPVGPDFDINYNDDSIENQFGIGTGVARMDRRNGSGRGRGIGPGGRGGIGSGRGNLFPGEPNYDHMKPPGW